MTQDTPQSLTHDVACGIASEEIGKVGRLLGESTLNGNEPGLEISEGDDEVRKDQTRKVVARVFTDQFDEPLPQPHNRGGLLGDWPLADGFGDICDQVGVTHNSSPSVDDAGAHSVGDGPGAGDASATPATEVTLDYLVAAVRDANLDIKSLRRIDEAALANYNESGRNLAKAIKDRTDSERALLDYLTGDQA